MFPLNETLYLTLNVESAYLKQVSLQLCDIFNPFMKKVHFKQKQR